MGKITINEIHNSLFDYVQTVSDNKLETNNKTIVGAINELFSNNNNDIEISNGKQLIANAIGEPLTAEDSFNEMSNDINGLLSTFKTNMMKNGVSVADSDKFKQLINKLATLADNEGKGIKYKTGNLDDLNFKAGTSTSGTRTLDVNFEFTPNIVFVEGKTIGNIYGEDNIPVLLGKDVDVIINNQLQAFLTITSYNSTSITFKFSRYTNELGTGVRNLIYHAIGVGEEDTTLRDSLASILEDEGVDVTEEDTMADLIVKTDEEFDRKNANRGLDIISSTVLPSSGVDGQICAITEYPVNAYILSTDDQDIIVNDNVIRLHITNDTNVTAYSYPIGSNKQMNLRIDYAYQAKKPIALWRFEGNQNQWVQIVVDDPNTYLFNMGVYPNPNLLSNLNHGYYNNGNLITGYYNTGITGTIDSQRGLVLSLSSKASYPTFMQILFFDKLIDMSKYTTLCIEYNLSVTGYLRSTNMLKITTDLPPNDSYVKSWTIFTKHDSQIVTERYDISDINIYAIPQLIFDISGGSNGMTVQLCIRKIWLE